MTTLPIETTDVDQRVVGDAGEDHRLLSVGEIQQALRELQARSPRPARAGVDAPARRARPGRPAPDSEHAPAARRPVGDSATTSVRRGGDTAGERPVLRGDSASRTRRGACRAGLQAGWIGVLAAHSGAGATTVALALSDAAAASGRLVHLVDTARSSRSGLAAAASEELGTDISGAWRRGRRTGVTIDRRTTDEVLDGWPVPPDGDRSALTVVDLGLATPDGVRQTATSRPQLVVVCRPTLPGVRLTEQLLDQLVQTPVVVAAVGPSRWSGEVIASVGPRLLALRAAGRVVSVPTDRRLQVTGPTSSPLPRSVRWAGRSLLDLVDNGHPVAAAPPSALTTRFAMTPEGTRR